MTDLERLLQTSNRRFPLGAFCAGIAPTRSEDDRKKAQTGNDDGESPSAGDASDDLDHGNPWQDVTSCSGLTNGKGDSKPRASSSNAVSTSFTPIVNVPPKKGHVNSRSNLDPGGKMTFDPGVNHASQSQGHKDISTASMSGDSGGIHGDRRVNTTSSSSGESPQSVPINGGPRVRPPNIPPLRKAVSLDNNEVAESPWSGGCTSRLVQPSHATHQGGSTFPPSPKVNGSSLDFLTPQPPHLIKAPPSCPVTSSLSGTPWHRPYKPQVPSGIPTRENFLNKFGNQSSSATSTDGWLAVQFHEGQQVKTSTNAALSTIENFLGENLQPGKSSLANPSQPTTSVPITLPASSNGLSTCPVPIPNREVHPVKEDELESPFGPRPRMETLTEPGVPHRHLPMANPGYLPEQTSPGRYFFGMSGNSSGYPGYPPRAGSVGGSRRGGEEDEARERSFNSQRFPSREDMNRESSAMSSDYGVMTSQSQAQQMTQFRQHQVASHRMSRFPDDEPNGPREEKSMEPPASPEKRPGLSGSKSGPDFAISQKQSPFDDPNQHSTPSFQKRGERPGSYPSGDRRGVNFGQPPFPDARQSVKGVYDPYDSDRQGRGDKPEAVPVAYDNLSTAEATNQSRVHQQQFRDKLERSTSHEASMSMWDAMHSRYGPTGNADHRPRAMTMDPSMQHRRENGPTSPYAGGARYPSGGSDMLYNMMREQFRSMKGHPGYPESDHEGGYPMHAAMMNEYRRSSAVDARSARQDMLNRMMMISPERLPREALSPFPQSSQNLQRHQRQKEMFGGLPPPDPTSPSTFKKYPGRTSSPIESTSSMDNQPQGSMPKDKSPFGANAPSTPHAMPNATSDQTKSPSTPTGPPQPSSPSSPKLTATSLASRLEAGEENVLGDNASPKTPPNESSFSTPKECNSDERPYGTNGPKTTPPYPSYMADDRQHAGRKLSSESLDNSLNESSRSGLMPKTEILSDDAEDDSFPSPTPPSPRSASMGYPAFPQQPFFPSAMGPSGQPHPFMSPRGPQDQMPGGPHFPFGKDMASRFPLGGMTPDMSMGPRLGPGPSFMGPMPSSMSDDNKDVYFCHLCSYSGKSKPEFDSHMGIHFEYNCPHCDYTSRTEGRLKRHIKDFHTDESGRRSMPGRPKVFKCKQCSFSATEKDKFWEHARSHIKEDKLLQCPKCPFVTEYKHHLEYHLRNHFGSKPFKCNKCNYSCVNKSMLNSHMKSHTNVYQYRCSDCTYATKYCHSLKLHLRKYNHKPATVLNQDGSLPHGLDVDTSGLSAVTKRGPPRGPRGPRKDKIDPYFMYGMPPVHMGMPPNVPPMLKGVMPFWPMMPQPGMPGPLHGHPGMLPGMPGLAHHMGGAMGEESDLHDRSGMEGPGGDMNESISDESNPTKEDDDEDRGPASLPCRLCDFVGDCTESLCMHLLQVHKEKTSEMAKIYGISESALVENMERARIRKERRFSESGIDSSEQESSMNEFHRRNTIAGLLSRGSYHGQDIEGDLGERNAPSWASAFESRNGNHRPGSLYMDDHGGEHLPGSGSSGGMDILQQMTLKFGDGAMGERMNMAGNAESQDNAKEEGLNSDVSTSPTGKKPHKESPLDLTKPKSVSPPMFSNPSSPKRDDDDEEDSRLPWMDEGRQGDIGSITEKLFRKRQLSTIEDAANASTGNQSTPEACTIVPRKRSRKGKAYKLDTICLKLQERQSGSPIDSDDTESDLEMNFDRFKPLQTKPEPSNDDNPADVADTASSPSAIQSEDAKDSEAKVESDNKVGEDEKQEDVTGEAEPNTDGEENQTKLETSGETPQSIEDKVEEEVEINECDTADDKAKSQPKDESVSPTKEETVEDEAENEFKKLQQTLNILNKELDEEEENEAMGSVNQDKQDEIDEEEDDDDKTVENCDFESTGRRSVDVLDQDPSMDLVDPVTRDPKEVFDLTDKENSNDGFAFDGDTPKSPGNGEIEDKVDLINTVLENRKKPLPPAVRRGTELAWKLLNDPVNPVTSIPIPAHSPPPMGPKNVQASPTSSSCSATIPGPLPSNGQSPMVTIRNGFRMAAAPPQAIMPPGLKPPMPVPLPPTPMAFIPPTNRLMPEPPMPRLPQAPPKPSPRDMYECTYCDLSFRDCVMYTVHMGYHSNRNPFKCNSCGIICRDKVEFFLHIARSAHS